MSLLNVDNLQSSECRLISFVVALAMLRYATVVFMPALPSVLSAGD